MSEENGNGTGADVSAEIGGQKINVRNVKSLNTIATIITLVVVCSGGVLLYTLLEAHAVQTKETGNEFVRALREQTTVMKEQVQVQREGNCLQGYQGPAASKAEFCRGISR